MDAKQDKTTMLVSTNNRLGKMLDDKIQALPKDFNKTRFVQNSIAVLKEVNDIEKCNPVDAVTCLLKGAFLGLDFYNKECYAIPYMDYKKNTMTLNFQTDYKGERKIMKKYSIRPILDIYAKAVREGDAFEEGIREGKPYLDYKARPFSNNKILGAFAVVLFSDGGLLYETMSTEEIENIKENFSKKSNKTGEFSKAWTVSTVEMYKKTVLRRLRKSIEIQFDTFEQQETFESASEFDMKEDKQPKETVKEESTMQNFIDAEFSEVQK